MLQEAASRHSIDQPVSNFTVFDSKILRTFDRPSESRSSEAAEQTEIELAFENWRGLQKSLLVHWVRMMVDIPPLKRRAHLAAMKSVLVRFGNGVETRMKVARNFFDTRDTNVWRNSG